MGIFGGSSSDSSNLISDASLGDQIMGGGGFGGSDATNSFGGFNALNNLASALGSAQAATPSSSIPSVAPFTAPSPAQSDPVGAESGTRSDVSPGGGQSSQQNQQQQQQPPAQQQPVPADAIQKLNELLGKLKGESTGPTGFVPEPPRTPNIPGLLSGIFGANARTPPPGEEGRDIGVHARARPIPPDPTIAAGGPGAGAAPAAPDAPVPAPASAPAPRPNDTSLTPKAGPQIPPVAPPATPVPEVAQPHQMSQIMRDLSGISHGNVPALIDLARLIYGVAAPLAAMGAARHPHGGFGPIGGSPFGGFRSPIGALPGYVDPREQQAQQDDRDRAQGYADADANPYGRVDKNGAPTPHGAFDRNGAFVASPDKSPISNQIPGVTPKMVDDYWRQGAQKRGMDPDVASKVLGAESGYGQNNVNKRDVNGYPDYGPPQLNMAPGALGDQFYKQTGINPADFAKGDNWKKMSDFALDHIAKEGWTDLYPGTSKKLGLSRWSGINRAPPPVTIRPSGTNPNVSFLAGNMS